MRRTTRLTHSQSQTDPPSYRETVHERDGNEKLVQEAASELVLYVLHNMENKKLLRRTALQKHITIKAGTWKQHLAAANARLNKVYGCQLVACDDPSVKVPSYYVKKTTAHINLAECNEQLKHKKIATFLLMSIVYMSNGKCSQPQLFDSFQKLHVIEEGDEDNFFSELLKELSASRMLVLEGDVVSWGPLAEELVNKMEILEFVSKVYGTNVESWGELHNQAVAQARLDEMDLAEDANAN